MCSAGKATHICTKFRKDDFSTAPSNSRQFIDRRYGGLIFRHVVLDHMTALLLPLMAYSLIGETAHEWLGTAMAVLFLGHHALNARWYKGPEKGRWSLPRIAQTVVNFALLLMTLGLIASGIILSREVFSFLPISGGTSFARTIHMVCSYWGFCLMSIHIGMHWGMVIRRFQRRTGSNSRRRTILLRAAAVLIAGYGTYAFFHREIGTYMTLKTAFVFFDFEEPLVLFFLNYLTVVGLFTVIGYYAVKLLQRLDQILLQAKGTGHG